MKAKKPRKTQELKDEELFLSAGTEQRTKIDVRISYRIIQLFSEGLYATPHKAIEELVSNAFDAGANNVHVITPLDSKADDATIAVIDDGEGMDGKGLRQHWIIGVSKKRSKRGKVKSRSLSSEVDRVHHARGGPPDGGFPTRCEKCPLSVPSLSTAGRPTP
jgi:hypothetical protein